jgi:hypothetical protein
MSLAQKRLKNVQAQVRQMQDALLFILAGKHNAASLASKLGVSVPTASRIVEILRKELARGGKNLVSVRSENSFHYLVSDPSRATRMARDPLFNLTIPVKGRPAKRLKGEDRDLYEGD